MNLIATGLIEKDHRYGVPGIPIPCRRRRSALPGDRRRLADGGTGGAYCNAPMPSVSQTGKRWRASAAMSSRTRASKATFESHAAINQLSRASPSRSIAAVNKVSAASSNSAGPDSSLHRARVPRGPAARTRLPGPAAPACSGTNPGGTQLVGAVSCVLALQAAFTMLRMFVFRNGLAPCCFGPETG